MLNVSGRADGSIDTVIEVDCFSISERQHGFPLSRE